ncbi:MAG: hypothetical protein Q9M26_08610 [Mariprofundales bacterium]|nr:hypothetical protein [Mariprofundales bacterium]
MSRILGVNWVEGDVHFAYVVGGQVHGTWHPSEPVKELHEFNLALRDACLNLGVKTGDKLALSYESQLLSHPFIHIPIMKSAELEKVLFRRAAKEKVFDEVASWSWTRTYPAKDGPGVLLHLLPRTFRNGFVRICEEFYLTPIRIIPLSEVMGRQVAKLMVPLEGGTELFCILVALFDRHTEILVARGDGTVLFLRDITFQWRKNMQRVEREVERTSLYAKQQFGVQVSTIWLTGDDCDQVAAELVKTSTSDVRVDPEIKSVEGWAVAVTELPKKLTSNLVPWYVQQRPLRRMMLRIGLFFAVLLVLLTVGTVGTVESLIDRDDSFEKGGAQIQALQTKIAEWQQRLSDSKQMAHDVQNYVVLRQPPAPLLLLRYLGSVQPQGVVLNQAEATMLGKGGTKVHFLLRGEAGDSPDQGGKLLARMEQNLAQPPLAARITLHGEQSWEKAVQRGSSVALSTPLRFELHGYSQ